MSRQQLNDPRRRVNNPIWAKACHVMSLKDCERRYGAFAKLKIIEGVVLDVITEQTKSGTGRYNTLIVGKYEIEEGTYKIKQLLLRSVMKEPPLACFNVSVVRAGQISVAGEGK